MRRLPVFVFAAAVLVVLAGCGSASRTSAPASPAPVSSSTFVATEASCGHGDAGWFPLAIGDRWDYESRVVLRTHPAEHPDSELTDTLTTRFHDVMADTRTHAGHAYVGMHRTFDGNDATDYWVEFRQDRAGLYEWDGGTSASARDASPAPWSPVARGAAARAEWERVAASLHVPASSAAWRGAWEQIAAKRAAWAARTASGMGRRGGILPGEIQRLEYPLHTGAEWVVRADPRFVTHVDGPAMVRTLVGRFPAWRLRMSSDLFSPDDDVVFFYGRAGYLGVRARLFAEATDENGNPIGLLESELTERLTGIHLAGTR